MSGWLKNALRFEASRLGDMWEGIKKDPKRLILGVDPLSTGAWNFILGRHDEPIVGDFGGPTQQNYINAENKGIPTGSAQTLNGIAKTIAAFYGGQAAGSALGGAAGAGASGGGTASTFAKMAPQALRMMQGQPVNAIQPVAPPKSMQQTQPKIPQQAQQPMNAGPGPVINQNDQQAKRRAIMAQILRGGGGF